MGEAGAAEAASDQLAGSRLASRCRRSCCPKPTAPAVLCKPGNWAGDGRTRPGPTDTWSQLSTPVFILLQVLGYLYSSTGYQDELAYAAAMLYKVTGALRCAAHGGLHGLSTGPCLPVASPA